jgi:hypothetical protein
MASICLGTSIHPVNTFASRCPVVDRVSAQAGVARQDNRGERRRDDAEPFTWYSIDGAH